jgi:hypothetical protein
MKRTWMAAGLALGALGLPGCKSKIASLRDALAEDDQAAVENAVQGRACTERACLDGYVGQLGGKTGFDANNPDQASAATVAVVVARDHHGEIVPDEEHWITALRQGRGPGADALRLAVAGEMAKLAPRVGTAWQDEAETTALVHDVAAALPGACEAYVALGSPAEATTPGKLKERTACVNRDLEREGAAADAREKRGVWNVAAGVQALWRDEAKALREGAVLAEGPTRAPLDKKLEVIEAATGKMGMR